MKQGDVLYEKLCPCVCSAFFTLLKFEIQSRMSLPLPRGQKASGLCGLCGSRGQGSRSTGSGSSDDYSCHQLTFNLRQQGEPGVPAASPAPSSSPSTSKTLFFCDPSKVASPYKSVTAVKSGSNQCNQFHSEVISE